eukprot:TRINITY_DN694_c0_g1_i1.p1 TRINITY_DN694_c0_g1~~TRINITY_DN694_c0_g1_i1.p1  ORF type:complete len:283 (+),score=71.64 TRINITY_DN694_c0_g1_i1:1103-1951(+)
MSLRNLCVDLLANLPGVQMPATFDTVLPQHVRAEIKQLRVLNEISTKMRRALLAVNCGSSSSKLKMFAPDMSMLSEASVDRRAAAQYAVRIAETPLPAQPSMEAGVATAVAEMKRTLPDGWDLQGVAHRVVHGGTLFNRPTVLSPDVVAALSALSPLAPLHNPPSLQLIHKMQQLLPSAVQIAVFDTAFHATLPPAATTYALPLSLARATGVRRYGFHGISHAFVSRAVAAATGQADGFTGVIAHLGSGSSVCAVAQGCSVDTSMGLRNLRLYQCTTMLGAG